MTGFAESWVAFTVDSRRVARLAPVPVGSAQLDNLSEDTMDSSKDRTRNDLTPEQKKVRPATEQDPKAVDLSVEELEERIAPRYK
jgi:hypothetical protein